MCIHTQYIYIYIYTIIEGCLEFKLPTIWTDEKQRRSRRKEKSRREKIREEKESEETRCRCAKRYIGKSRNTVFFPMIFGSRGSKSRLAKAAGAEAAGQMRDEKLHAVVARSTFPSQNVQNTTAPDHFWKLRCRKSACSCAAKHMSKSKCTKHLSSGTLLEVEMSKKCTPLWREAHFEVKMRKAPHVRALFGRSDVISRGRRKGKKGEGFVAFPKTMTGVGHLKRICKDAFSVAGAVQKTCSSELLRGPGADFLREVAFWSIRSSGLLRWFCVTGAALRMTWHHFFMVCAVV